MRMLAGRVSPYNKYILKYIRENMIDDGAAAGQYKPDFDLKNPPWSKLGRWGEAHKFIINYFKNYKVSVIINCVVAFI